MHRAHRSLWILTALTIFAAGLLSQALTATAGPAGDALFAASLLLLLTTATLLVRIIRYLSRTTTAQSNTATKPTNRDRTPGR